MAITLYDATVPNFLQVLAGLRGVLDKGLAHAKATGVDPETLVETRLCGDMHPLRFQVVSVAHHSRGALEGVERGRFSPPQTGNENYAALQALVAEAEAALGRYTPEQINKLEGRDLNFVLGDRSLPFVAEDFLFSFSLPNFYFHATTAYDILRWKGVPLGKRDFMGRLRRKKS